MNRTDRLLAIILELQRHGMQRAEDLAATFETSKRTIYRDIEALAESGVPVVSTTGQGYSLIEGYFLPPLSFTTDEATMLLLGTDAMSQSFDAQGRKAAQSAAAKIEGALTPKRREDVRALKLGLSIVGSLNNSDPDVLDRLQLSRRAITDCRHMRFRYFARFADTSTGEIRDVEPHRLMYVGRTWYLSAVDLNKEEVRHFRLDRMQDITLLPSTFERPTAEALQVERRGFSRDDLVLTVRALFDPAVARWVREERSWFAEHEDDTPAGLLVTFRVRREDELLQYLLQWGSKVRVLEPASLVERMQAEAKRMLQVHQPLAAKSSPEVENR